MDSDAIKICVISDTHQCHNVFNIPSCDIFIHCGDFSFYGNQQTTEQG